MRRATLDFINKMFDILEYCKKPRRITDIVFETRMNFPTVRDYIAYLLLNSMLMTYGDIYKYYRITDKGREFLLSFCMENVIIR